MNRRSRAIQRAHLVRLRSACSPSSYLRFRASFPAQSAYPDAARVGFIKSDGAGTRLIIISATAGYFGGTPTAWDISVPDFGSVAGFSIGFMLYDVHEYFVQALAGAVDWYYGADPQAGDVLKFAYRSGGLALESRAALRQTALPTTGMRRRIDPRRGHQ